MENKRLKFLQSFIGKHFTESPSPYAHWLNGKVISVEEKAVEFQFEIRKDMTNPVGMLHGGVTSGMIDDCIGVNFMVLGLEKFYPTINLYIDYFNPAFEGQKVLVRTKVEKLGKTIINIKADVINENTSKLVAQASANLALSDVKIPE
ncbi:PaaI family thioesterase [Flavobacterium sp. MC2016-06]|jgi:acyl-coenzyme A thioesterase 13|uniref:PaaI family thioesterase n=1 Tax=Flavobacterium sp. MC2016-06 TaxID=2676308 RepID=UPI0012BAEF4F|nr:PaaI family thioesterase [Flavobacterium sp. MC2016-06]MBU3858866.1 PaaI family thioesterase [Flavobacterium sp. MC2016-06]